MSRFLRAAGLAVSRAMGHASNPRPFSGLFLASDVPSGAGQLGLIRARPGLRDLNALLTPEAFLFDATHVLGAAALRVRPYTGGTVHQFRDIITPAAVAWAEAQGDADLAELQRVLMALVDAGDGRFEDALARLAAERPDRHASRLCTAAVCDMLGRVEEGQQSIAGIPEDACLPHPHEGLWFQVALVAAKLGGAPGAATGSEGRVAAAALQIINRFVSDCHTSVFLTAATALLKRAVKRTCQGLALECGSIFRVVADAATLSSSGHHRGDSDTETAGFFVLQALQALLSAVVLRAPPLSGERVRAALRVAERDLARAVEEGYASAVAALRLLIVLLAARDGRFGDALECYVAEARNDLSDPWPRYLAHVVCVFAGQMEEADKWKASYERLGRGSLEEDIALCTLTDELVVALALGGSPLAFDAQSFPSVVCKIMGAAASRVDVALVSTLRDKKMLVAERLELRAVRAFLHAGVWSALKELKGMNSGSATGPSSSG
ncbi:hypothetical protein ACP70R_037493 [Stipagrostis hirtigluma subsp. patula]